MPGLESSRRLRNKCIDSRRLVSQPSMSAAAISWVSHRMRVISCMIPAIRWVLTMVKTQGFARRGASNTCGQQTLAFDIAVAQFLVAH